MKKILYLVTIVFFLVSAYLAFDFSSKQELSNLLGNDKYSANISAKSPDGILTTIINTSNKYDVNVQKSVYRLQEDGSFAIDIFANINKQDVFYKKLILKSGNKLTINSPSSSYLSTISTHDDNKIGIISLLNKSSVINIKKMSDAGKENINGIYYFTGIENDNQYNQILSTLKENGINIDNEKVSTNDEVSLDYHILSFIPLLLLLVIITIIYNYIMAYKEISVMMLNGYSCRDVIQKKAKNFLFINSIIALITASITIGFHFIAYGVINFHFYLNVIFLTVVLDLVITIIESISGYVINTIDITICLRKKKPQKQINLLNLIAKICFSFIIIFLATNSAIKIKEFDDQNYNLSAWQESINYAFTTFSGYNRTANSNTYEVGLKCKELYSLLDKKGAILMRINGYYRLKGYSKELSDATEPNYFSESIEVNNNYLIKNPIYTLNGNKVNLISENEDILTVLVPEKYLPQKEELEKKYIEAYQTIRYFDENLYYEDSAFKQIDKKQEIRFQYIKNGQKIFSFDPEVNPDGNNYIIDPVILLTNSNNRGTDVYFSIMTSGEMLINITNPSNPYDEVIPYIKEVGLESNITATPTVYSKVDQKQYELNQILSKYIFMLIISLVGYIIITTFITLNYLESNKEINVIKTLFGYSFVKRNIKYYLLSIIPIVVLTPLFIISFQLIAFNILTLSLLTIIDFLTISITLFLYDRQSINDVLKGS